MESNGTPTQDAGGSAGLRESAGSIWAAKAAGHARARLHFARDMRGHLAAQTQAEDAVIALVAAGMLAPGSAGEALTRLALRLQQQLDCVGHPDLPLEIDAEIESIRVALASAGACG